MALGRCLVFGYLALRVKDLFQGVWSQTVAEQGLSRSKVWGLVLKVFMLFLGVQASRAFKQCFFCFEAEITSF